MNQLQALAEGLRLTAELRRAVSTVRDKAKADRLADLLLVLGPGHNTEGDKR